MGAGRKGGSGTAPTYKTVLNTADRGDCLAVWLYGGFVRNLFN